MTKHTIIVIVAVLLIAGGLAVVDHRLKRADRIRYEIEGERLRTVQDAILRFALDRQRGPVDLAELVPAYLSESSIRYRHSSKPDAMERYSYAAESGVLAWQAPFHFNGLFPKTKLLTHTVPIPNIVRDSVTGQSIFEVDATSMVLGDDTIVIEAETFQQHTYGWEIERSDAASGKSYIHLKEGAGDLSDASDNTDFYNVSGDRRRIEAKVSVNGALSVRAPHNLAREDR